MINTDLVKEGVAVRCNSVEEAKELFESMGWKEGLFAKGGFKYFWEDKDDSEGWDACSDEYDVPVGTIIDFSELKQSRLASILGVKEGQEFMYDNDGPYVIKSDGYRYTPWNKTRCCCEWYLSDMINNPDKIKPIKKYSQETIEDAKAGIRLGLYSVGRSDDGERVFATNNDSIIHFGKEKFIEVNSGHVVYLQDIIANEQ